MSKIKPPSYSNVILTSILAIMAWNAKTTFDLSNVITGVTKEVTFNTKEHDCFKIEIAKGVKERNINAKNILINRMDIVAIKHELELEVLEDE